MARIRFLVEAGIFPFIIIFTPTISSLDWIPGKVKPVGEPGYFVAS
jgi:hypothetical protein